MSAGSIGPLQLQTRTSGVAELRKECPGGGSRRPIVLAFVELEGLTGRLLSIDRFPSHPEDAGQLHPHLALGCRLLCLLAHLDGFAGKPLSLLELPA
jgi:hypothetical protein